MPKLPFSFVVIICCFLFQGIRERRCFPLGSSHHVVHACLCLPCPMMRRELLAFFVAAVIFLFLSGRKTFFFSLSRGSPLLSLKNCPTLDRLTSQNVTNAVFLSLIPGTIRRPVTRTVPAQRLQPAALDLDQFIRLGHMAHRLTDGVRTPHPRLGLSFRSSIESCRRHDIHAHASCTRAYHIYEAGNSFD